MSRPGAPWVGPAKGPALAFAALWVVQAALAGALPLVADEAYYLAWSRDLGPGYLDHPPGIAWWVALGGGHPRLPGLLLVPLAWLALADAARRWGVVHWRWLPALAMATPLGFSAGLIATPDVPLLVCWCFALWAVAAERTLLLGLALGLGLWSKSALLVALPGLLWAVGPRRGALALLVAAAVYGPHVHWSLGHDGLPWSFQSGHRVIALGALRPFEVLGGQLLLVTPLILGLAFAAWRRPADAIDRRLRALGLPVLALWLGASLLTRVEANWPALAWPAALVLVMRRAERVEAGGLALVRAARVAVALTLLAAAALPLLDRWRPFSGPPRDGARLAACLDAVMPGAVPVARRYQEKALLDAAGAVEGGAPYLRAAGHRVSEYDRRSPAPPPPCGFIYMGDRMALDGRCAGGVQRAEACGQALSLCRCP